MSQPSLSESRPKPAATSRGTPRDEPSLLAQIAPIVAEHTGRSPEETLAELERGRSAAPGAPVSPPVSAPPTTPAQPAPKRDRQASAGARGIHEGPQEQSIAPELANVVEIPQEARKAVAFVGRLSASLKVEAPEIASRHAQRSIEVAQKQVERAKEERATANTSPRLKTYPHVPKSSPRSAELENALWAKGAFRHDGSERWGPYLDLDRAVRATLKETSQNPLWLAADHVERHPGLLKVDDLLRESEPLAEAKRAYREVEQGFVKVKRELDAFERRPLWYKTVARVVSRRARGLTDAHDQAARNLVDAKGVLDRATQEERWYVEQQVSQHNGQALARQAEARAVRDELELPLREAARARYSAEQALTNGYVMSSLADATSGQKLLYAGERSIAGYVYQEFRSDDGRAYLGDKLDPSQGLSSLDLVRGDQVRIGTREHVGRAPEVVTRSGALSHGREPLVGELGALVWKDDKLERLQLTDPKGQKRWVHPRGVDGDLTKELGRLEDLRALKSGDTVRIQGGSLTLLGGAREHEGQGR